jgi:hypothetical protein
MDADHLLVLIPIAKELPLRAVQPRIGASATFYFHRDYSGNRPFCQGFVQYFNLSLTFADHVSCISRQNMDNIRRVQRFLVYIRLAGLANR